MLKLILSRQEMARPYAAPPGHPGRRKAALRKAFDDAWADPDLLARMKARGQEVNPVSGAALDALIASLRHAEGCRWRRRGARSADM
jgi:tripartite-type tricarboxylate transporter receptor subunit TctC